MPCFDLVKKQRTPEFFLLFFKLRLRYWSTKINRGRKLVISAHCRYIAFQSDMNDFGNARATTL